MKKIVVMVVLLVLTAVSPAAAALNEYYTYGGFAPVTLAFENIGLIFSNSGYKGVIGTLALFGILFGCSSGFLSMAMGKGGPLGWLAPFLIGSFLYMGLFKPTMPLAVYDPVYNQNKMINGIPVGVVYVAGIINLFERFVVETYDANVPLAPNTACGPLPAMQYQEFGGAVGMRLMNNSAQQYVKSADASQTLLSYVNDCVVFELNRPGTTLTLDQLLSPGCGKTSLDIMAAANSPANFTTSYFGSSTGTTKTCEAVYTELTTFFENANNTKQAGMNACAGTGFTDWARCEQILSDMVMGSTGDTLDAHKFIGNSTVVGITNSALLAGGGAGTTQYLAQMQTGSSSGALAGIINPHMIDAYVAYSFMLMPILALFLLTPLWKNAFLLIISLLVWTSLLRSLDVITFHMWASQYQIAAAAALNGAGMGIEAAMQLPTIANQYLGDFASKRSSAFLLATAVSGALFKFGDSALSRLADKVGHDNSGVTAATRDRGFAAKLAMDNSAGAARASMMTALAGGTHGWDNVGKGMAANEFASAAAGAGMGSAYSGVAGLVNGQSIVANRNATQASARAGRATEADSKGMGVNEAASQRGVLEAMGRDGKLAGWQANLLAQKNLGDSKGYEAAYQASGYKGSISEFQSDMTKVVTQKGFMDSQGWKDVVNKRFGGDESKALQAGTDVAAYQLSKHMGEVEGMKDGSGKDAPGVGWDQGLTTAHNNLMSLASDNVRRAIANESAGNDIKNNPALYNKGGLTEAGKQKQAEQAERQKQERAALGERLGGSQVTAEDKSKLMSAVDAKQAAEQKALGEKLKNDPSMYRNGKLTEAGKQKQAEQVKQHKQERAALGERLGGSQVTAEDKSKLMSAVDAKQAAEQKELGEKLKNDPTMYRQGGLTGEGYSAQMGNIAGANQQGYVDTNAAYGPVQKSSIVDRNGQFIMTSEKGSVSGKDRMGALAQELRQAGFKHTAKEIDKMAKEGKAFDFALSRDKDGRITGFNATGGASATLRDKAVEETGRLRDHTDLDKSTVGRQEWSGKSKVQEDTDKKLVDRGLRETIGNHSKHGDRFENFSEKKIATPDGMETGYYYKAKNGTEFLVSGQKDGLLHHKVQKDGKAVDIMMDPRTGAVLLEKGESGKKEVIFANRSEYQGGTAVSGSVNTALSNKIADYTGWDEKTVQLAIGTAQDVGNSIMPVANAGSGARANTRSERRHKEGEERRETDKRERAEQREQDKGERALQRAEEIARKGEQFERMTELKEREVAAYEKMAENGVPKVPRSSAPKSRTQGQANGGGSQGDDNGHNGHGTTRKPGPGGNGSGRAKPVGGGAPKNSKPTK